MTRAEVIEPPAPGNPSEQRFLSGRYLLEAELGRGGVGTVYRALDLATKRVVALKLLERSERNVVALFEREYHVLASLKHPSVIEVHDFGVAADGRRYYTMALLAGQELVALAPLPWRGACQHLRDVAASLSVLHARRLLHRDVSPRNVRLDGQGRAKLLDFGALCEFGEPSDVVGTPTFMAPEAVKALPLDQRADLFSLGATAYFALTGRTPFAIRGLRDAERAYRTAPAAPSEWVAEVPPALDQLVLSLLSLDPLKRPSSAAEVMERLCSIADLAEEACEHGSALDLLSTTLVGRTHEKTRLKQQLERVLRGQGAVLLIEGEVGSGRTRLGQELLLDARTSGLTTLHIGAASYPEPYGSLRALCAALLRAAPLEAEETLLPRAAVLGQLFAELRREQHGEHAPAQPLPPDPRTRRACVQDAFVDWVLDVAGRRPLCVLVDDVDAADASSAGAFVLLAQRAPRARLMLATTSVVEMPASAALQQLVRVSTRIRLRALVAGAVDELVASLFGEAHNRSRLARWLYAIAKGNPAQTFDLLKHLVERGLIRYENGAWALPMGFSQGDLPATLEEALAAQLALLSPEATRMVRLFAVHRGTLSLEVCLRTLPSLGAGAVASGLRELSTRGWLASSGEKYRLANERMRKLVLARLSEAELAASYLALAQALNDCHAGAVSLTLADKAAQVSTEELGVVLAVGWYLDRSGQPSRGRALLRRAATELGIRGDGLADAVPALEHALESYRAQRLSSHEYATLLVPLTLAGTYADYRLSYRHGYELVQILCDVTGMNLARRLAALLGRRLAVFAALSVAFVLYHVTNRRAYSHSFRECLLALMGIGSAELGTSVALSDSERAARLAKLLEPLGWFPRKHAITLIHDFQRSLLDVTSGRYHEASERARGVLAALRGRVGAAMPRDACAQLEAGILALLAPLEAARTDGRIHASLAALRGSGSNYARQVLAGALTLYHAQRGECARFAEHMEQLDVLAAQAGGGWRHDVVLPRLLWSTYALSEDVMSLKRSLRDLEVWAAECPWLTEAHHAAHAAYLAERGQPKEALARYEAVLTSACAHGTPMSARYAGCYARILRGAGQPARARDLCQAMLASLREADAAYTLAVLGVQLELALALADMGQFDQASAHLDTLVEAQQGHDNPLVHGLVHKARARVAMMAHDRHAFEHHLGRMDEWFRRSDNPVLIAQSLRLAEEIRVNGVFGGAPSNAAVAARERARAQVQTAFAVCRGSAERLQKAIDLLVEESGAERGYLYLVESDGPRFVAPNVGFEPPEDLCAALAAGLDQLRAGRAGPLGDGSGEDYTTVLNEADLAPSTPQSQLYHWVPLTVPSGQEPTLVGAVALLEGEHGVRRVSEALAESIALAISGARDVRTIYAKALAAAPHASDRLLDET